MRRIRRCALLIPLLSACPTLAGRTDTQLSVTATVVPSCRSIGTTTWPRAGVPPDGARLVRVDCGAEAGFRIRGPWPATVTLPPLVGPVESGPATGPEDAITVTVEF